MRRAAALSAAALCAASALGMVASQRWVAEWVSNYVARAAAPQMTTSETNGVVTVAAGDAVLTYELPTCYALRVVATSSASYTNGTIFVWNGAGAYVSRAGRVECTATNMVCEGVGSAEADGLLRFAGLFDVLPVRVQPSAALAATNGVEEAAR